MGAAARNVWQPFIFVEIAKKITKSVDKFGDMCYNISSIGIGYILPTQFDEERVLTWKSQSSLQTLKKR